MSFRSLLLAAVVIVPVVVPVTAAAADADAGARKAYTCLGCHGSPGYDNSYPTYKVPKIWGQHETYLAAALIAYGDGSRQHPTMSVQGAALSDEDIADISAYFAAAHEVAASEPVGEEPLTQVCVACHQADGVSTDPNNPILAGQYQDYLEHALRAYRSGDRANAIMAGFAAGLSDEDIEALAAFYARQSGLVVIEP